MNNRLRYRIWWKSKQKYIDDRMFVSPTGRKLWNGMTIPVFPPEDDDFVVEFCTGISDKNGNPICDGDIIHDLGDIEPVCGFPLVVRWSDRTAGFYLDHQKIGMRAHLGRLDSADSHNYEIVGNIHEQAEQKD